MEEKEKEKEKDMRKSWQHLQGAGDLGHGDSGEVVLLEARGRAQHLAGVQVNPRTRLQTV